MSKSIVTLQLGNFSNFVGSHYWNLHEFTFERSNNNLNDNDINYYEGVTINNRVTFTPKVISWDWKQNLGPRIIDDIYEKMENDGNDNAQTRRKISSLKVSSYNGKVEMNTGFSEEELNVNETNEFLHREYFEWNEYLYANLHPNSLTKLPKLYRNFDSSNFKNFSQGLDLTKSLEYYDRMEDQTRYFVEKCDILQGFQVLCDVDDGFSGVGMNFLNNLADEYSKDIISFPISNSPTNDVDNIFNKIFLLNEMNSKSVFCSPLSTFNLEGKSIPFPDINYNSESRYQASAILAVALKSLLSPCFLTSKSYTLSDFASVTSSHKNNFTSLALSLPFPLRSNSSVESSLTNLRVSDVYRVLNPLSPVNISRLDSVIGHVLGVAPDRAINKESSSSERMYRHCSSSVDVLSRFIPATQSYFTESADRLVLRRPFPEFFSRNIDPTKGELIQSSTSDYLKSQLSHCPASVPVSSILFSANTEPLTKLYEDAKHALKMRRIPTVMMQLESDYLLEAVENFRDII